MTHSFVSSIASANFVGFLLAICGNTLIACSLTLQKRAHNALSSDSDPPQTPDLEQPSPSPPNDEQQQQHNSHHHLSEHEPPSPIPSPPPQLPSSPPTPPSDQISPPQSPPSRLVVVNIHSPPSSPSLTSQALLSPPTPTPPPSLPSAHSPNSLAFLRSPVWWVGTLLMAFGEIGNFAAFAFAPASLVAPLGAWSVVLSAILAHLFLSETISTSNLAGILLCVAGAVLIGTSAPDVAPEQANRLDAAAVMRLLVRAPFVLYILATLTVAAALIYVAHRTTLGRHHVCVYVGVSSVLGGVTVVCAKALSTFVRITLEGASQFGSWLPFALAATLACAILLQLRYLNMAMAQFGNAQVIPVYYVLFTSCALMSGVVMYREFDQLSLRNIPFFLGICATMSGVFLVTRSADGTNSSNSGNSNSYNGTSSASSGMEQWDLRLGGAHGKKSEAAAIMGARGRYGWSRNSGALVDEQAVQEHLSIIKLRELDDDDDDGLSTSPLSSPRSSQVTL